MHRIAFHHKYSYGSSERNVSNSTPSFDVFKGFRLYLKRRSAHIHLVVEPSPQGSLAADYPIPNLFTRELQLTVVPLSLSRKGGS